jgi:hypothetical protein
MKRFDRKEYADKLSNRSNTIKNRITYLDETASDHQQAKETLINELEANRSKIREVYNNTTRILIATTKDTINNEDIYQHFYYLADLDIIQTYRSNSYDNYDQNAVDLRSFFSHIGLPKTNEIDTSITLWFTIEIIRKIINDLFSKKEYHTWKEVKIDIEKISENYKYPEYRETHQKYEKRVLKK